MTDCTDLVVKNGNVDLTALNKLNPREFGIGLEPLVNSVVNFLYSYRI